MSVLIPTRDRPDCQLVEVVQSCIDLALDKELVEVLIKVDEDDFVSSGRVVFLQAKYPGQIKQIVVPKGRGYLDIARYLNELAKHATGDWLFVLGDNTRVATQHWDSFINFSFPMHPWLGMQDVCMLKPNMEGFPLIRRRSVEIMGCLTQVMSWDFWFLAVFGGIQCSYGVSINLAHKMSSPLSPEEKQRRLGAESRVMSTATRQLMHEYAGRLLFHLQCAERDAVWSSAPAATGWHLWERSDGARAIVYVDLATGASVTAPELRPFQESGLWTTI